MSAVKSISKQGEDFLIPYRFVLSTIPSVKKSTFPIWITSSSMWSMRVWLCVKTGNYKKLLNGSADITDSESSI